VEGLCVAPIEVAELDSVAQEAIVVAMPGDEPDEETDRWLPMAIGVGTLESARVLHSTLLAVCNLLIISYLSSLNDFVEHRWRGLKIITRQIELFLCNSGEI
jgi:hypothetical protein